MNSPSWSKVDFLNTGAVSRMKSFQNCPGSSSTSGGGASRIRRSSKPFSSRVPAKDSSATKRLADADAVVGRPERALREEDDRLALRLGHARSLRRSVREEAAEGE